MRKLRPLPRRAGPRLLPSAEVGLPAIDQNIRPIRSNRRSVLQIRDRIGVVRELQKIPALRQMPLQLFTQILPILLGQSGVAGDLFELFLRQWLPWFGELNSERLFQKIGDVGGE